MILIGLTMTKILLPMFASCPNIAWLNLSSWDLTNAYNITKEMFFECRNLRWIFAYNCNDDTINKINEALQNAYDNGWVNNTVEVYCDQNEKLIKTILKKDGVEKSIPFFYKLI